MQEMKYYLRNTYLLPFVILSNYWSCITSSNETCFSFCEYFQSYLNCLAQAFADWQDPTYDKHYALHPTQYQIPILSIAPSLLFHTDGGKFASF